MLGTVHLLAGAAVGRTVKRPWLALPVAFASHFLLDAIPHLGPHSLFGVDGEGPQRREVLMAAVDVGLGVPLLLWLAWPGPERRVVLTAALYACLPDLLFNIPPWCAVLQHWAATGWLAWLHDAVDSNVRPEQWPLGVMTQLAVAGAAGWLLRRGYSADSTTNSGQGLRAKESDDPRGSAAAGAPR
jgi:hypothetical protein